MTVIPLNNVVPGLVSRVMSMPGAPTVGTSEVQAINSTATAGAYKLSFGGARTVSIAFDANATQVQNALVGLPNVPAGGVSVTGTGFPKVVTFAGELATGPQPLLQVVESTLNQVATVSRTTAGVSPTLQGSPKGTVAHRADTGVLHTNTGTAAAPVWTPV